ncbi:MAG TPA: hypothetical protein VM012_13680 [Flavitalea sp.]|nr:hypothetical protein [Flavitalea sp.]
MKQILLIAGLLFFYRSEAQVVNTKSMFLEDITGKPFLNMNTEGIEGSPFLSEDWFPGQVRLKDGRVAEAMYLRFNMYGNKLYFQRDGKQLEFVDPVSEFVIRMNTDVKKKQLLYRSEYPPVDEYNENTFYEVLTDGKVQLLRYGYKTVEEYRTYNEPPKKKFVDKEAYFVYTEGKIVKVKRDKEDLMKALPAYANTINLIVESQKLKLKNTEALSELIAQVNKRQGN